MTLPASADDARAEVDRLVVLLEAADRHEHLEPLIEADTILTPLHLAASQGAVDFVGMLLEAGADPT